MGESATCLFRVFWRSLDVVGRCGSRFSRGDTCIMTRQNEGAPVQNSLSQWHRIETTQHPSLTLIGPARLLEYSSLSLKTQPAIPSVPIASPAHRSPLRITAGRASSWRVFTKHLAMVPCPFGDLRAQVGHRGTHQNAPRPRLVSMGRAERETAGVPLDSGKQWLS